MIMRGKATRETRIHMEYTREARLMIRVATELEMISETGLRSKGKGEPQYAGLWQFSDVFPDMPYSTSSLTYLADKVLTVQVKETAKKRTTRRGRCEYQTNNQAYRTCVNAFSPRRRHFFRHCNMIVFPPFFPAFCSF